MFKIGELNNLNDEKIEIEKHKIESHNYLTKEISCYNILSFSICGKLNNNEYSYYFEIDEDIKKLLEFNKLEKININNMVKEKYFNLNDNNGIDPIINDIYLTKYVNNKFNVLIYFIIEDNKMDDKYVGDIEFDFNLDDYLGDINEIN